MICGIANDAARLVAVRTGVRVRAALTAVVVACMMVAVAASPAAAAESLLYVRGATGATGTTSFIPGGADSGMCASPTTACATVSYALTQAAHGATIEVSGTIHDHVTTKISVTISGADAPSDNPAVLDGSNSGTPVSTQTTAAVYLDHLTIQHGSGNFGGGISSEGLVTLTDTTVSDNTAISGGGGAYEAGSVMTLIDSTISTNTQTGLGYGGGLFLDGQSGTGSLVLVDSTVSGNATTGTGEGGGIAALGGTSVTLTGSTVSGNMSAEGGGMFIDAPLTLTDSTVSGNNAGGIDVSASPATLTASTVSGNSDHGIDSGFDRVTLAASILTLNGSANCEGSGTFISAGYNLTDGAGCGFTQPTDIVNASDVITGVPALNGLPALRPLSDNGGPTQTMMPTAITLSNGEEVGGQAVGVIPRGTVLDGVAVCEGTDQRGFARPQPPGSSCAIGAAEPGNVVAVAPAITSAASVSVESGGFLSFQVTATGIPAPVVTVGSGSTLPAGATLTTNANGIVVLGGIVDAVGVYSFTLRAANGVGADATQTFTLAVDGPPSFTSAPSAIVLAGVPFDIPVTVTAVPAPAVTLASGSTLPNGVSLTDKGGGTAALTGAAQAGSYFFEIRATNGSSPDAYQGFALTVNNPPPTVSSFTPTSAVTGSTVTISGTNFAGANAVTFGTQAAASFTVVSGTQITATVPNGATSGTISVTTPQGTATSAAPFEPTLSITRFGPASGPYGTFVTINGVGFTSSSTVKFNGVAAAVTFVSSTELAATVPPSTPAGAGRISVTNTATPVGTVLSAAGYTLTPHVAPSVTAFTPTSAPTGSSVTITGTNFSGASAVKFGGSFAPFTVESATQIVASVPNGAVAGTISVTTAAGTGTSSASFKPTLSVSGLSPTSGPYGTVVTITGIGFTTGSAVKFNGIAATAVTFVSATQLKATVPPTATSGRVTITNATAPAGAVVSAALYTVTPHVAPTITSFTPTSGIIGSAVTITGADLSGASAVKFGSLPASFTILSATQIKATVPTGAVAGVLSVTTAAGTAASSASFTPAVGSLLPHHHAKHHRTHHAKHHRTHHANHHHKSHKKHHAKHH